MGDRQQLVMLYLDLEDRSASVQSCTDEQPRHCGGECRTNRSVGLTPLLFNISFVTQITGQSATSHGHNQCQGTD